MDRWASVHAATTGADLVRLRAAPWCEVTQRAVMVAAGHQPHSDDYAPCPQDSGTRTSEVQV
ncbi:MAG TPA: hypothetical protein VLW50_18545 [Streptosporangiaceae bacterium]|nr:hypothetical protein [Streptosporangiaceae bacterium]